MPGRLVLLGLLLAWTAPAAAQNAEAVARALRAYEDTGDCGGPEYRAVREALTAQGLIARGEAALSATRHVTLMREVARGTNALAAAAAGKRCLSLSRRLYTEVLEDYRGDAYAAEREVARAGVDLARSAGR